MRNFSTLLSVITFMLGMSAFAGSQEQAKSGPIMSAAEKVKMDCAEDMKKFCSDINAGDGRMAACLKSKSDQLSDSCKTARGEFESVVSTTMDKTKVSFRKSCSADVQKFCADVPSGKGRLWECLSEHENDLTNSCKNFRAKLQKKLEQAWR